jgi:hypothetical protein
MDTPASSFSAFCRKAFDFLEGAGVRHLVIGGLAVGAIGEARTTADVDVIAFVSPEDAVGLIPKAADAGCDLTPETEQPLAGRLAQVESRRSSWRGFLPRGCDRRCS